MHFRHNVGYIIYGTNPYVPIYHIIAKSRMQETSNGFAAELNAIQGSLRVYR